VDVAVSLQELLKRGAEATNIRIVCVVACPPALSKLSEQFPGVRIYAAMIDAELNDEGYIVPGLGDAGDRAFGTAK
jgi:uracil phosphoribosyltransferase